MLLFWARYFVKWNFLSALGIENAPTFLLTVFMKISEEFWYDWGFGLSSLLYLSNPLSSYSVSISQTYLRNREF